jgi:hypothetical protein
MKTHGLTTKIKAKKPKNVRNCESWASREIASFMGRAPENNTSGVRRELF